MIMMILYIMRVNLFHALFHGMPRITMTLDFGTSLTFL